MGGPTSAPRISVVVASSGRPEGLAHLGQRLARQSHPPHRVVLSVGVPDDLPRGPGYPDAIVVTGPRGLPGQRNRGLERVLADSDLVAFFDDDYLPSHHALAGIARFFDRYPDHVGINGTLLADGINSAGISFAKAEHLVDPWDALPPPLAPAVCQNLRGLYGCNMAFRAAAIGTMRFDERLPLYGWQEDIDFSARLLPMGRLCRTDAFVGVHCGIKSARSSGVRLGYSQVANPLYLARKGTMRPTRSAGLIAGNVFANLVRSLHQEPWVDRRGRARGNWLALRHAAQGRIRPEHVLKL